MTDNTPPVDNSSLRNRLVALTRRQVSVRTVGAASARLFSRAMRALALPVVRRFVLPGEPNPNVKSAITKVENAPKGTRGVRRKDGSLIAAVYSEDPLKAAIAERHDLSDVYLVRHNMFQMVLDGAKMPGADLRLACLRDSRANSTDLTGADLRRAVLTEMRGEGTQMAGADLSEVRATDARLTGANLRGAKFAGAELTGCRFNECDLRDVDFTTTKFEIRYQEISYYEYHSTTREHKVQMRGADLRGARFSADADFDGMDLRGAKLDGVLICDRKGQPIPGAVLKQDGTILYMPQGATCKASKADEPELPGPGGR